MKAKRGRDESKLVEGLKRQVEAVRSGLAVIEQDVPIGGCFCFVNPDGQAGGSGIPLFRTLSIEGFPPFYPRKLSKHLRRPGPSNEERIEVLADAQRHGRAWPLRSIYGPGGGSGVSSISG